MNGPRDAVIAIVPARYASSRFPGKPLEFIHGKTLIQRCYENVQRCPLFSRILIATDDERIYNHAKEFGADVVMTSATCPTGTDRLAEVMTRYPISTPETNPIIINIQGDEPCLDPHTMESVAKILLDNPSAVMSTAVTPLREEDAFHPSVVKCVLDRQGHTLYYSRALIPLGKSQQFRKELAYYRHLGIYGYRKNFLIEYARLPATPLQLAEDIEALKALEHGYRIQAAIVGETSIGVDEPEDIKKVERYLCGKNNQNISL